MAFDPLYPTYVNFHVSQEIWNLFEIYISQLILNYSSKTRIFRYLRWRYEKNPRYTPAVILITVVYVVSWLILIGNDWLQQRRQQLLENGGQLSFMTLLRRLFALEDQMDNDEQRDQQHQQQQQRVNNNNQNERDENANRLRDQRIDDN